MRVRIAGDRNVTDSSAATFVASFYTDAWVATTPTTVRYKLTDASESDLIAWTTVTPGTSVTITIPAASNAPADNSLRYDVRLLTVQADNGLSSQVTEPFVYQVRNLRSIA